MRYRDLRQLKQYLTQDPARMSHDQLNHFDNLLRCQTYEISCLLNNYHDRQLLLALYQMNCDRYKPRFVFLS